MIAAKKLIHLFGSSSKAIILSAATRILLLFLNLATSVFVAHSLGPTGRGELSALVLWPPLLSTIFTMGIPNAFLYFDKKEPDSRDVLFTAAMMITAVLSVLMVGIGWLLLPLLLHQYSPNTLHIAQLILITAPEMSLSYIVASLLQASNRFGLFNLQRYFPFLTTLILLLIVKSAWGLNSTTAAICYAIPPTPIFIWTLFRLRGLVRLKFANILNSIRNLVSYGSRASGISLLGTIAQQADQVLVIGLLSATSMGMYAVALSASRVPNFIFLAISDAISAKAMSMPPKELTAFIGRALRLSVVGGALTAGGLGLALPVILPFFYGGSFHQAVGISEILLLEVMAYGLSVVISVAYLAVGRPGLVTFIQGGSLLFTVPLMLVLIPRLGLAGAAISLLLSSSARFLALFAFYRSAVGTAPPGLLLSATDFHFVAARFRGLRASAEA